jgi:hypothetical protein
LPQPDSQQQRRDCAFMILNRMSDNGPKPKELVPDLIPLVASDDKRPSATFVDGVTHHAVPHGVYVRAVAADLLADIGPAAAPAVPVLIQQIELRRSQPDYMFNRLPRSLGLIGAPAKDALPVLTELLRGTNSDTALYAAEAMCRIDPQQRATVNPGAPGRRGSRPAYRECWRNGYSLALSQQVPRAEAAPRCRTA